MRSNTPLVDPNGHKALWDELLSLLSIQTGTDAGSALQGKRVMDIGPAEGFFTLSALAAGAKSVDAVQPGGQLLDRLVSVLDIQGFSEKVEIHRGHFPEVGSKFVDLIDIFLVLGVVYHAYDCEAFVSPLLAAGKPICWEFMYAIPEPKLFDPGRHNNSSNGLFSREWLESKVTSSGHEILQCERYNERCLSPGYLRRPEKDGWSRAAFVSVPQGARRNTDER